MIENKINNKKYIGQSVDIKKRWSSHKHRCKNKHLKSAFKKYGIESFIFSIIEECPRTKLNERESFYIEKYKTFNKNNGYNKTSGGDSCFEKKVSEETKIKISITLKGRKLNLTKEQFEKRSYNFKGSKNINAKKVFFNNKEYQTIAELANELGISPSTLKSYVKGKNGSPQYIIDGDLKIEGEKSFLINKKAHPSSVKVVCDGVVFDSIKECATKYNINSDTMRSWFKKNRNIPAFFLNKGLKIYKEV